MSESLASKSFTNPDVLKEPEKTHSASVDLGVATATKLVLQPGWKWSECVKPLVGGHSCQAAHVGVVIQGSMTVAHDDGSEITVHAGDAYTFAPGHDGWHLLQILATNDQTLDHPTPPTQHHLCSLQAPYASRGSRPDCFSRRQHHSP